MEPAPGPVFNRTLLILGSSIFVFQVYSIVLWGVYGFSLFSRPDEYYFHLNWVGLLWYGTVTAIVINDLDSRGLKNLITLDLRWSERHETWRQTLYYIGTVFLSVALIALFLPHESEIPTGSSFEVTFLSVFSLTVAAPVCEEIWFRGYLYPAMFTQFQRKRERLIVNAMLFATGHVLLVTIPLGAGFPYYIFIIGFLLADLYERSRSIVPCILVHAANNATLAILELAGVKDPFGFYG